jgi:hypothetical protein
MPRLVTCSRLFTSKGRTGGIASGGVRITTASLPNATEGVAYSKALVAVNGVEPYDWAVANDSPDELPTGLTLDSETGVISGTPDPATADTLSIKFQVTDDEATVATRTLSLRVLTPAPVISSDAFAGATVDVAYDESPTLTEAGELPGVWILQSGALPTGTTLDAGDGSVSGTPTVEDTFNFTLRYTDAVGRHDDQAFSIEVSAGGAPEITTEALDAGVFGEAYSFTLQATGGSGGYTWAITDGALPAGLSLNTGSGAITGTPTEVVTDKAVEFTVTAAVGGASDPAALTLSTPLNAVFADLISGYRAADYDEDTGDWPSFNAPSTHIFEQGTELLRPAEGSDAAGVFVDFGGSQYVDGNAAVLAELDGLDDCSGFWIAGPGVDLSEFVEGGGPSTMTGMNMNSHTTGAGSTRMFMNHTGTFYQATNAGTIMGDVTAVAMTVERNTANQPVGYVGATQYVGSSTIKDSALGAATRVRFGATADATPILFFNGNLRVRLCFGVAKTEAQIQALRAYLSDKVFWGTSGVNL